MRVSLNDVFQASVFDTQRRILEDLRMMQMQIEAIGAPTPESLMKGDYNPNIKYASSKDDTTGKPSM